MLYTECGIGKTCTIFSISTRFVWNVYNDSVNEPDQCNEMVNKLFISIAVFVYN